MSRFTTRRSRLTAAVAALALGATPLALAGGATAAQSDESTQSTIAARKAGVLSLQLLAINDFHGQLEVVPFSSSGGRIATGPNSSGSNPTDATAAGGAAYLSQHLKQLRQRAKKYGAESVTVAAGDLIGATPLLSAAFHDEPSIEALNEMGLDIASVGNHEFDEGWRELKRMQRGGCLDDGANGANNQNSCPDAGREFAGADFRYLAANVKHETSGKTVFPGYKIKKYGKVKVGFIGMTLKDTPNIVTKAGVEGLKFTNEVRTVRKLMPKLRKKGVKSIVVLLHQGAVPNPSYQYNECPAADGPGLAIAQQLPAAVDAVISGHTHQAYNCSVTDPKGNQRLFTSAASTGRMVTEMTLQIDKKTKDVIRPQAAAENIIVTNSDGTPADSAIVSLIERYTTLVAPIANEVLGQIAPADASNNVSRAAEADGGDSPLGNLIAESQLADESVVTNGLVPDIAFMNPGGIRSDLNENDANNVTYGAAFAVQPFNNYVTSQTLTGQEILNVLNEQWNGRNEGAANNKILQVAGLRYTWDRTLANLENQGALIGNVLVGVDENGAGGTPIDPAASYRVVVNSFLSDGGDGFATFAGGRNKFFGGLDIDALASYLEDNAPYAPTPLNRISNVPAPPLG